MPSLSKVRVPTLGLLKSKTTSKSIDLLDAPDLASRLCTEGSKKYTRNKLGKSGRENFTVLAAGAADSTRLPPLILYEGIYLYQRWTKGGSG